MKGKVIKDGIHTEIKKAAMNWGLKAMYKPVRFLLEYSELETVQNCNSASPLHLVSSLLLIDSGVRNATEFGIC